MGDITDLLSKVSIDDVYDEWEDQASGSLPEDAEIENVYKTLNVKIKVIGCGGGGSNTVNRLYDDALKNADLIAINTDASHLRSIKVKHKLLIGQKTTKGLGTGADPKVGEEAAIEEIVAIKKIVQNTDITFVTAGLGGGTGTGCAPVIARAAKEAGSIVISVVTLPFESEGPLRMDNAVIGLEKLAQFSDTLVAIPNQRLLSEVPNAEMKVAFAYADKVLADTIRSIVEIITKTGIINIDYSDIKTVMQSGGVALIGMGQSKKGGDRIMTALEEALKPRLIDVDVSTAKDCVFKIIAPPDITVSEVGKAMDEIKKKINPRSRIIWGLTIDKDLDKDVKVLIFMTGVSSAYLVKDVESARKLASMFTGSYAAEIDTVN
ncbi:cell division protein FtsZ [Thermoplasma acidophilum]|uniref:cell division protein FtsZ n=1 Tax=Thermoplasma acidophilum TaxID=2303 RepID=UPI0000166033|nr:cell division protein FtsZ [Thermoplasma acidophilum]CAC11220.1 cell division protein FtsZ [Thermoplasma acidophilum]